MIQKFNPLRLPAPLLKQIPVEALPLFVDAAGVWKGGFWEQVVAGYKGLQQAGYQLGADGWVKKNLAKLKKISKIKEDEQLVFGFFSVVEKAGEKVIDYEGDYIDPVALEKAAYDYVINSRQGDDRHDEKPQAILVESMFFSKEKQELLGIDLELVGWFGGFKILNKELWEKVKRGERAMFSIGGMAYDVRDATTESY